MLLRILASRYFVIVDHILCFHSIFYSLYLLSVYKEILFIDYFKFLLLLTSCSTDLDIVFAIWHTLDSVFDLWVLLGFLALSYFVILDHIITISFVTPFNLILFFKDIPIIGRFIFFLLLTSCFPGLRILFVILLRLDSASNLIECHCEFWHWAALLLLL